MGIESTNDGLDAVDTDKTGPHPSPIKDKSDSDGHPSRADSREGAGAANSAQDRIGESRSRPEADEAGNAGTDAEGRKEKTELSTVDAVEYDNNGPEDERLAAPVDIEVGSDQQTPQGRVYRFGNKEAPRAVRLMEDLKVDSPDDTIGPFSPLTPGDKVHGASTYIDPDRAPI